MMNFHLNSREFYEAVRRPADRPWIANGALPPEPRARDPEVIVERRRCGMGQREPSRSKSVTSIHSAFGRWSAGRSPALRRSPRLLRKALTSARRFGR